MHELSDLIHDLLMTTIRSDSSDVNVMGLPPRSSHTESPSPHFRLDTVAAAEDMNNSELAHSRQPGGATGDHHENTKANALPTRGDHRTSAHSDTPTPPRTVRKKKSSYDLRDEFQHPEFFTASSPDHIVSSVSAAKQELGAATRPPSSHKTPSPRANGVHGKRHQSRTE